MFSTDSRLFLRPLGVLFFALSILTATMAVGCDEDTPAERVEDAVDDVGDAFDDDSPAEEVGEAIDDALNP